MSDVHFVGRINIDIFRAVYGDIQTNEVIITDVQIEHIKERHPNDYCCLPRKMQKIDKPNTNNKPPKLRTSAAYLLDKWIC